MSSPSVFIISRNRKTSAEVAERLALPDAGWEHMQDHRQIFTRKHMSVILGPGWAIQGADLVNKLRQMKGVTIKMEREYERHA